LSKHRLDFEYTIDFELVGVVSAVQEYKMAYLLNQQLKLQFKRTTDWEVTYPKKKDLQYFKKYDFKDELLKRVFYLIKNKNNSFHCLPELSILDYLFIISGDITKDELSQYHHQIKKIPIISSALIIEADKIKNIENIFIDEENF